MCLDIFDYMNWDFYRNNKKLGNDLTSPMDCQYIESLPLKIFSKPNKRLMVDFLFGLGLLKYVDIPVVVRKLNKLF